MVTAARRSSSTAVQRARVVCRNAWHGREQSCPIYSHNEERGPAMVRSDGQRTTTEAAHTLAVNLICIDGSSQSVHCPGPLPDLGRAGLSSRAHARAHTAELGRAHTRDDVIDRSIRSPRQLSLHPHTAGTCERPWRPSRPPATLAVFHTCQRPRSVLHRREHTVGPSARPRPAGA